MLNEIAGALLALVAVFFVVSWRLIGLKAGALFTLVTLIQTVFAIIGWFVLPPFCITQAWELSPWPSIKDGRAIDEWSFEPLNWIYGNPEDGVSGQHALIWQGTPPVLVPYMATAAAWWRAFCWNCRNSADQLKYFFAWKAGPLYTRTWGSGKVIRWGWHNENGHNVPVLSLT